MVDLPKGVHRVVARGREYFYWQPGRGTKHAAKAVRLPDDPTDPAFWGKVRELQGRNPAHEFTFNDVIDLYEASPQFAAISEGSKDQYRRGLRRARLAWGHLSPNVIGPNHVLTFMDGLANTPGAANVFLGAMRAFSSWAVPRKHLAQSIVTGVKRYASAGGHKPWTDRQIAAAHEHLTGMVRRGILLALYTGQRGSDVVRLGWTMIDEGGFSLTQRKTGREVWCPIVPELAAEMSTWERRPGPFLLQANGRPYTRRLLYEHFDVQRRSIPELASVTIHGLRATACDHFARAGLGTAEISGILGMSMPMIERYRRFADRKASGKSAIIKLKERRG